MKFVRSLMIFSILWYVMFELGLYATLENATFLGKWLPIIIIAIFGIYVVLHAIWEVIKKIMENSDVKVPFQILYTKTPKLPINNANEERAVLASVLYESSCIAISDNKNLKKLAENPYFQPEYKIEARDYFYVNALEYASDPFITGGLKDSFELSWEVKDKESALETLSALWESVDNDLEVIASADIEEIDHQITEFGMHFDPKAKQTNAAGFHLIRLVWVARASYACGYIDEGELRQVLSAVGECIGANYRNWQELAYSYLVSFMIWAISTEQARYFIRERVLCVKECLENRVSPLVRSHF
ncbi:DUF1266 domain-containing protein [Pasteurella sp. PK-2025]|uniref:DUF1266 domain-containing protein n=1 Tax=unclassified Pasteurella TaxID=2621516 RepID=UPI003C75F6ED